MQFNDIHYYARYTTVSIKLIRDSGFNDHGGPIMNIYEYIRKDNVPDIQPINNRKLSAGR